MASLKLNAVNKVYPSGSLALYDATLEAKDREFIVIVGGEKSGKSTLLRVIAGLEEQSTGEIFIGDKDMTDVDPKDRDIAMIFTSSTLYPALTVYDNMAFGLRLRKAAPALIDQRVRSAAAILGLEDVLYRKPKVLSAAQKQRVAIARAIVREPKLYLFDDPLSGLDGNLKSELLNVIINMQARMQGTFIYATKNVNEALTIGTRIVVMKNGIIQQIDSPANLYDYPVNAYVAFFIGAPTINFIDKSEIVKTEEGLFAVNGDLKLALPENIVARFENVNDYVGTGKKVIIGIRPEDAATGSEGFESVVSKVESAGEDFYAECSVCGHSLVVKTQEGVEKDKKVKVAIDTGRLYLFDAETRLTLLKRDGGYVSGGFAEENLTPLTFAEETEVVEKFKPKKNVKKKK